MEPIAGLLMAAGAVLAITLIVRKRRARAAAACAVDGSCGCGPTPKRMLYSSPDPVAEAPIACTADLRNREAVQPGIDTYRSAFSDLIATERTANGFRWRFHARPRLEATLQHLATAEHACCSFMKFDITTTGNEIVWETSAEPHAREFIDEYMRLPERLREESRPGRDVAHLKHHAVRAGIAFTSDAPR